MMPRLALAALLLFASTACTQDNAMPLQTETVRYDLDGTTFESTIVHHGAAAKAMPGVLMVPNWMGPTAESLDQCKKIAADGYVVMMVDMYGVDTRPKDGKEAGAAAGKVRGDRAMMRARANKALAVFRDQGKSRGLDGAHVAAIGFCFGGGTVLELGRSGAELDAIVTFHGDLVSPTLAEDAGKTKAKVLVCHGANDPYVPQKDVQAFVDAYAKTAVDWQLLQLSGAVHSFTDLGADSDGARYDERAAKRAFAAMKALFDSLWRR
ncbi:MAG: dienelactone hydrolase family protein [Planctomycetota bacterium]